MTDQIKNTSGTRWQMAVFDDRDPVARLEADLAEAVDKDQRPQVLAAIRHRIAQGKGPSFAVLGDVMRKSRTTTRRIKISAALEQFNRSTSQLIKHYGNKAEMQFSNRPSIFRYESVLRMRRMLMTQLEALITQPIPNIELMGRQLDEIQNAVSIMGGVPVGFGLQRLFSEMRHAASEFGQTRAGCGHGGLALLQRRIDHLQQVWPLNDPKPELLSDDFVEEIFFQNGNERSVQMTMLLDIIQHSDRLLRYPVTTLGRALETEWNKIDAYLLSQFAHRYGRRYMPEDLRRRDAASMDPLGAMEYDDSWKSYRIMWEMERALGRQGENASAMLPSMVKRFVFLTGVLSSYIAMLKHGISLHSGKGRMTHLLKDMPELEELAVLSSVMQAIDPNAIAGHVRRELTTWLARADISPEDRGYIIWRLKDVLPADDIKNLAGRLQQRGIVEHVPNRPVDPNNPSLSDYILAKRAGREFHELVSTVRDLSSTPEESAKAIQQIGLIGGKAAAGLLKEIVMSAPPQLVPRDNMPQIVVPSENFMGNCAYWQAVTPAAINAMSHLGVALPPSIISTTSYARAATLMFGVGLIK